jgi:hypothetical protein
VLVVVEHRDVELLAQTAFDLETMRCGDVFQIDAAEGRRYRDHGLDEVLRVLRVDLDVEHIDAGEALEQHALAFHHRLAGQGADIAETQHRRSVGDHADQIALGRVFVGVGRILRDRAHRLGDAWGIRQRQILLSRAGFGHLDTDLSGARQGVVVEGGLLAVLGHGRFRRSDETRTCATAHNTRNAGAISARSSGIRPAWVRPADSGR